MIPFFTDVVWLSEGLHFVVQTLRVRTAFALSGIDLETIHPHIGDLITYPLIFASIASMAWLIQRDRKVGMVRSDIMEASLRRERDDFEKIIAQKNHELLKVEDARLVELKRSSEFGKLSQGLIHDLMSPLTSISLYLEQLENHTDDPKIVRQVITNVVDISKRMRSFQEVVRNRLKSTTTVVDSARVSSIKKELGSIKELLTYKARMAGVDVDITHCDEVYMKIHPLRLQQLFSVLISNAIEACHENGLVEISARHDPSKSTIVVKDNGRGMSQSQLDKIMFGSFTTKSAGTGIGLMTVKQIVEEELSGTVNIESDENVGTSFTLRIPTNSENRAYSQPQP